MIRYEVKSTNLRAVSWDPDTRRARVEFVGCTVYEYDDVPGEVVAQILFSSSPGAEFARTLKLWEPGRYRKVAQEAAV